MWFVIAVALAGHEYLGYSVGGDPSIDDAGLRLKLYTPTYHFAVRRQGQPEELRCPFWFTPCAKWSHARDVRRRFPNEASMQVCAEGTTPNSPSCAEAPDWDVYSAQLQAVVLQSDLSGRTSWSSPVNLVLHLEDPARWKVGDGLPHADLPAQRVVTVDAAQADRWRCSTGSTADAREALLADPRAGMTWLTAAAQRCEVAPTWLIGAFCAGPPADADAAAWCAVAAPSAPAVAARVIHHRKVEWLRQIQPSYPRAARGHPPVSCRGELSIDPNGVPTDVVVEGCPAVFANPAGDALLRWRAQPILIDGAAVSIKATVIVNFGLAQ
jgi:hypothetical protein